MKCGVDIEHQIVIILKSPYKFAVMWRTFVVIYVAVTLRTVEERNAVVKIVNLHSGETSEDRDFLARMRLGLISM